MHDVLLFSLQSLLFELLLNIIIPQDNSFNWLTPTSVICVYLFILSSISTRMVFLFFFFFFLLFCLVRASYYPASIGGPVFRAATKSDRKAERQSMVDRGN
jgi:hypothetical protein